jgi:NAD(P)-dependent dehydrogenase (short-subunit alcohol dehydrogenase family)
MAQGPLVFLVTGCSSGIGRATAEMAASRGHRVFATARDPESIDGLRAAGAVETLRLDVTRPDEIRGAIAKIEKEAGRLDVVVNNAGYAQMGPVEDISLERWRAEFDANFFGTIAVTQAALPLMRRRHSGTIVNIGSVAGRIAYPFGGAYCSSKHALEALSDALRLEVERFGIRVVLIEPGPILTRFGERVEREVNEMARNPDSPYHDVYDAAFTRFRKESRNGAAPPEAVARAVLKAAEAKRPSARYAVTAFAKVFLFARRLVPDALMDAVMRAKFR